MEYVAYCNNKFINSYEFFKLFTQKQEIKLYPYDWNTGKCNNNTSNIIIATII